MDNINNLMEIVAKYQQLLKEKEHKQEQAKKYDKKKYIANFKARHTPEELQRRKAESNKKYYLKQKAKKMSETA